MKPFQIARLDRAAYAYALRAVGGKRKDDGSMAIHFGTFYQRWLQRYKNKKKKS